MHFQYVLYGLGADVTLRLFLAKTNLRDLNAEEKRKYVLFSMSETRPPAYGLRVSKAKIDDCSQIDKQFA